MTATPPPAGVTGWHVLLPDAGGFDAVAVLGRKGLINKVPATRLGLGASHQALGLPLGVRPQPDVDPRLAVVACSTLGNVDAVLEIVGDVTTGGLRAVSPLAAPNASANVLASSIALRFGAGGPNLMVVDQVDGGARALRLALRLLTAGRAQRVLLVGAESAGPAAAAIGGGAAVRSGAACLVLETGEARVRLGLDVDPTGPPSAETGLDQLISLARAVDRADRERRPAELTLGPDRVRIEVLG